VKKKSARGTKKKKKKGKKEEKRSAPSAQQSSVLPPHRTVVVSAQLEHGAVGQIGVLGAPLGRSLSDAGLCRERAQESAIFFL
jgi:hypothetical protein